MESLIREVTQKLEKESVALGQEIEPQNKALTSRAFQCMSNCYKGSGSMEDCGECADKCNYYIQEAQEQIQTHMTNIQNKFSECMKGCAGTEYNESQKCVNECTEEAISNFSQAKLELKSHLNKLLTK